MARCMYEYEAGPKRRKPNLCPYCPYFTRYLSHMRAHEYKHTGLNPFVCTFLDCGYAAKTNSTLTRHAETHNGMKKCTVDGCRYVCKTTISLNKHAVLWHTIKCSESDVHPFVAPPSS